MPTKDNVFFSAATWKKIWALEMFSVSASTYLIISADLTKLPWKLLNLDWHEFLSKNKESGWKQNYCIVYVYVHSRYIVYYRYMNDFLWSKLESIFLGKASSRFRIVQKIEARTTDPQWRLNPTKRGLGWKWLPAVVIKLRYWHIFWHLGSVVRG